MNTIVADSNFIKTKKVAITITGKAFAQANNTPGEDGSVGVGDGTDFIDLNQWLSCQIIAQGYGSNVDITGINIQGSIIGSDNEKTIMMPLGSLVVLNNPPPYIRFHNLSGGEFTYLRVFIWGTKRDSAPYEITDIPLRVVP